MGAIEGLLIDIDGVLTVSWEPIDGAPEAMATLRGLGIPLRFATNTTTRTRAEVASLITSAGMPVEPGEILTAPVATAVHLRRHHPGARCFLLNSGDLSEDLEGIELADHGPSRRTTQRTDRRRAPDQGERDRHRSIWSHRWPSAG